MLKGKLQERFAGQGKAVVAMVHFPPTPGSPLFDAEGGIEQIMDSVLRDARALSENGVRTVMFCNEGDRPYQQNVGYATPVTMASVVARVVDELGIKRFGVDVLWDPKAALALAKATGASFLREVFTGLYAGDTGFWATDCGEALRYRKLIDAEDVALLFNINAEFASSLDSRQVAAIAKSVRFSSLADVLCVSGAMTGMETPVDTLRKVKEAVGDETPVFANTGVNRDNVKEILSVADGVVIGTHLKVDGNTWNPVDPERVRRFMDTVGGL